MFVGPGISSGPFCLTSTTSQISLYNMTPANHNLFFGSLDGLIFDITDFFLEDLL